MTPNDDIFTGNLDPMELELLEEEAALSGAEVEPEKPKPEFVKSSRPQESTSYKNKLIKVYDDLELINVDDIEEQIKAIKEELKAIILEIDESDKRLNEEFANKVDETTKEDNDLHYLLPTKKRTIKEANESVFTPLTIAFLISSIALFLTVLGLLVYIL